MPSSASFYMAYVPSTIIFTIVSFVAVYLDSSAMNVTWLLYFLKYLQKLIFRNTDRVAQRLILLTFLVLILRKGEFHENFLRVYNVLYSTER